MHRVRLTEEQRKELKRRTRTAVLKPRTRDRLERVRLSDGGLTVPQISQLLQVSPRRVRFWLKRFLEAGFEALPDQPHPGQTSRLTPELLECVGKELEKADRIWTIGQLATWLAEEHGVTFSRNHLGTLLRRTGLSCRRTERDLAHKQDPQKVTEVAADLETLEMGQSGVRTEWRMTPHRAGA